MLNGYYFDGRSPMQKTAQLWFDAHDAQFVVLKTVDAVGDASENTVFSAETSALDVHQRRYPVRSVDFGEPTKQGQRIVRFADDGQFVASDAQQAHQYLNTHQHSGGWVANITLKWPWVAAAFVGTAAAVTVFYTHGIPMLARVSAPHVPVAVSKTLGDQAFEQLERSQFKPSNLPQAQQAAIRQRWAAFLAKQAPETEIPKHTLYIRSMTLTPPALDDVKDDAKKGTTDGEDVDAIEKSTMPPKPQKIIEIPNAMALPNGAIVLTDGLVKLLEDKPDAVMGVLAHELGHLQHRHSMRLLIEVSALSGLSAIVLGDASGFITQAPLLLGVLSYSREHESEADDSAIVMMRAAGVPSSELAVFFERARGFVTSQTNDKAADKDKNKTAETSQEKTKDKTKNKEDAAVKDKKPKSAWDFKFPDWLSTHPSDAARIDKLKRAN
jgi:Zn-dependent protease with chaperone function